MISHNEYLCLESKEHFDRRDAARALAEKAGIGFSLAMAQVYDAEGQAAEAARNEHDAYEWAQIRRGIDAQEFADVIHPKWIAFCKS